MGVVECRALDPASVAMVYEPIWKRPRRKNDRTSRRITLSAIAPLTVGAGFEKLQSSPRGTVGPNTPRAFEVAATH
jgi:hypothetical protein